MERIVPHRNAPRWVLPTTAALVVVLFAVLTAGALRKPLPSPPGAHSALYFQLSRNPNDEAFAKTVAKRIAGNQWVIKAGTAQNGKTVWEVPLPPGNDADNYQEALADPDIASAWRGAWPPGSPGMFGP